MHIHIFENDLYIPGNKFLILQINSFEYLQQFLVFINHFLVCINHLLVNLVIVQKGKLFINIRK